MSEKILFEHMQKYTHEGVEKGDGIQLAKDTWKGRDYFTIRSLFLNQDGEPRWAQVRADRNDRYWAALKVRPEAMRELGQALIDAADKLPRTPERPNRPMKEAPRETEFEDDQIPF